jgi:hypothetical protein
VDKILNDSKSVLSIANIGNGNIEKCACSWCATGKFIFTGCFGRLITVDNQG